MSPVARSTVHQIVARVGQPLSDGRSHHTEVTHCPACGGVLDFEVLPSGRVVERCAGSSASDAPRASCGYRAAVASRRGADLPPAPLTAAEVFARRRGDAARVAAAARGPQPCEHDCGRTVVPPRRVCEECKRDQSPRHARASIARAKARRAESAGRAR